MQAAEQPGDLLEPDELREIDRELLAILTDGRTDDRPWGRLTPEYAHGRLIEDYGHEVEPQYVQQRLEYLRSHDHLTKVGRGLYELVNDPRTDNGSSSGNV